MFKKWSKLILPALLASKLAYAGKPVEGSDVAPVQVDISAAEANRLAVEGRKITWVVPAQPGMLAVERDDARGILYFRLTGAASATGTVTLFVTDDQGSRYRLVLVPRPVSGEEIVIKPAKAGLSGEGTGPAGSARATSYQRKIKNLVLALTNNETGRSREQQLAEVPLWNEARLVLLARVAEAGLVGESYRLTNVAATGMLVEEREFYRRGVLAVSVVSHTLGPGDSTELYVVKEGADHE